MKGTWWEVLMDLAAWISRDIWTREYDREGRVIDRSPVKDYTLSWEQVHDGWRPGRYV